MDRRRLLRLSGVILASGFAPDVVWNNVIRIRHSVVDSGWASAAVGHGNMLAAAYRSMRPVELLPHVEDHLDLLGGRLGEHMSDRSRRHLELATGESAALAGELALVLGRWGQADGHLALAEQAAREADDLLLTAQVLVLQGLRRSRIPRGEFAANGEALAKLEQAASVTRYGAPPITRAWVNSKLAGEYAVANRGTAAARAMTAAERALWGGRDEREQKGLFSVGSFFTYWNSGEPLRGFEGVALMLLGDRQAGGVLEEGIAASAHDPVARSGMWADLMAVRARAGDPEGAVDAANRALDLAEETGFTQKMERVGPRIGLLEEWGDIPGVVELRERLTA